MGTIPPDMLGRWFDQYGTRLALYARQWLDGAAAEDAVQEAFAGLIRCRRAPGSPRAWLFRAVRNAALSHLRSRRRRDRREQAGARAEWFLHDLAGPIDAAAAQAALLRLPRDLREVVVMRVWGGLGLAEIAAVVGRPVSTVFSRYRAALTALRERMSAPCNSKTD